MSRNLLLPTEASRPQRERRTRRFVCTPPCFDLLMLLASFGHSHLTPSSYSVPPNEVFFQNFCSIFREHLVRFCMCVFVHEGVRASVRVGHIRRPSAEGIFASRELVGRRLSLGLVQFSACLCERMCVCLHTCYVGLRSIASVAPVHPSLPQTINSVIATLRRMHRPKQSAKRKGVIDGGSCCPNEFND